MADDGWGDSCIECWHAPNVHGITVGVIDGKPLTPCECCEAPHVIAAAQEVAR